ncbi:MAG TPA: NUDIX domain-containing protein [Trebonia sp.]|nr:NUDIX domain-containing protein [Trebonia sp.]
MGHDQAVGKQELGETVAKCAIRETREETGVTVEVTGLLGIYSDPATSSPTPTAKSARNTRSSSLAAPSPAPPPPTTKPAPPPGSPPTTSRDLTSTLPNGASSATGSTAPTRESISIPADNRRPKRQRKTPQAFDSTD